MRTFLHEGSFYELCPLCGYGGCKITGGSSRLCPYRDCLGPMETDFPITETFDEPFI